MAKTSRTSRSIRIANRSSGGLWWRVPVALGLWAILVAPLVALVVVVVVLRHYVADLPEVPDLDGWDERAPQTSVILAADGTILAEIPFRQNGVVGHRSHVPFARMPALVVQAFLAAEDVRFFEHHGVDTRAVVRAAWINYRAGRVVEGASTITQQVARNLLPDAIGDERTLRRKVREALMARRIETYYSKERIFEVYVNHVFLGAGAYGVAAAAHAYFAKELHELELHEAAMIAGLAQAPGRADPWKDRDAARTRRDQVLERMARAGFIDATQAEQAMARPLGLSPPGTRYGRVAPWYTEHVRREVEMTWPEAYARGGLRVETGLWPGLAHEAEMLALDNARRVAGEDAGRLPEVGTLIWDHRTGYVEATVGGLSWSESRFDRATQACRQPGSAFKPVLYAAALEGDIITPGTPLRDAPIAEYDETLDVYWKPDTGGRAYRGVVLAQDALASSLNPPAVDVFDRVGGEHVIDLARRLGISTELADVRPLALGASCVKPIELAGAFAVFARRGLRARPIFAVRVYRPGSRETAPDDHHRDRASPYDPTLAPARRLDRLADTAGERPERVLDEVSAFLITAMLRQVVERGTATAARALGRPVAGKTGTTNDNTDAWFVGFSSRLVAAVWIGHDDPAHTLGPRRDGAHAALPLWMQLIALAEGERPAEPLLEPVPAGVSRARVDRETGLLAEPHAGGSVELYFRQGTEPTEHAGQLVPGVPMDLGRVSREF